MSFSFQKGPNYRIVRKAVPVTSANRVVTVSESLGAAFSVFTANITTLSLNNTVVTATPTQFSFLEVTTPGVAESNKVLKLDNTKNISNINTLSCNSITVNGVTISGPPINQGSSQFLSNITTGTATASKILTVNSNRNINGINQLSVNKLKLKNIDLLTNRPYDVFTNIITTNINLINNWNSMCWSNQLNIFVAVASSGTGNRVMTSPDGVTWTSQISPADNNWNSICWAPDLNKFAAVASSGNGNRVMTSSNGTTWTTDGITYNNANKPTISMTNISAGASHSMVLMSNGTIRSWGSNNLGQLGDGTTNQSTTPVTVSGINNAIAISIGENFSIALLNDGTIRGWGLNSAGRLGDGTTTQRSTPVTTVTSATDSSPLSNVIAISAGWNYTLALLSDGTIKAWGWNNEGRLGDGTTVQKFTPVSVVGINNAIAIDAGVDVSVALLADGTVKTWGNGYGLTPVTISGISNAIAIAAQPCLALISDGTVKSWNGTAVPASTASNITNAIAISSRGGVAMVLLADGTIRIWGASYGGTPTLMSGISNAIGMSSSYGSHYLALLSDGTVRAWGTNTNGQLGNNSTSTSSTPVIVQTSSSNSSALSNVKLNTTLSTDYNNNNWTSVCWSSELNLYVAIANSGSYARVMTSPDGSTWTGRTCPSNNWTSICWAPSISLFIAVASSGTGNRVMTSPDGINWTNRTSAADNSWISVCWSESLQLAVALANDGTNRMMISHNGINWASLTTFGYTNEWQQICWSSDLQLFIGIAITGDKHKIIISDDGYNWATRFTPNNNCLECIAWSPKLNKFCILTSSSLSNVLSNLTQTSDYMKTRLISNWSDQYTLSTSLTSGNWGNNLEWIPEIERYFIPLNNRILVSPDGLNWTSKTFTNLNINQIEYSQSLSLLIATTNSNKICTSLDSGDTWQVSDLPNNFNWPCAAWSPELSLFVILATNSTTYITSSNGTTWTSRTLSAANSWTSLIWVSTLNLFVAISNSGTNRVMTSPDGINWTFRSAAAANSWISLCYGGPSGGKLLVAISSDGTNRIMTSTNGTTWTSNAVARTDSFGGNIIWSEELQLFIIPVNNSTSILYSSNGTSWTLLSNILANTGWRFIAWSSKYSNLLILAGTIINKTSNINFLSYTSQNSSSKLLNLNTIHKKVIPNISTIKNALKNWESNFYIEPGFNENGWSSVIWAPTINRFIAVAKDGTTYKVMHSTNGSVWNGLNLNNQWTGVCWANEISLAVIISTGASSNALMTSSDITNGGAWTNRVNSVSLNSICWSPELNMFVAVGNSFATYSYDGITWTNTSTIASSTNFTSICWANSIYLFIAVANSGTNRIWTSPDGINWTARSSISNNWTSICWSDDLNLAVAVSNSGTGNRIITSPNGISWTTRSSIEDNDWSSICYAKEINMFVAVASSSATNSSNRLLYSQNGINWKLMPLSLLNQWQCICWSSDLSIFLMVSNNGSQNRIYRSKFIIPTYLNSYYNVSHSINENTNSLISNRVINNYYSIFNPTHSVELIGSLLLIDSGSVGASIVPSSTDGEFTLTKLSATTDYSFNVVNHNGSNSGLSLNDTLITASADNLNAMNVTTNGIVEASKALIVDSNKNISNINELSVNSLTLPNVFNYTEGISQKNKPLLLNSSKNISNINNISTNSLVLNNSTLNINSKNYSTDIHVIFKITDSNPVPAWGDVLDCVWAPKLNRFIIHRTGNSTAYLATSATGTLWNTSGSSHSGSNSSTGFNEICWADKLGILVTVGNFRTISYSYNGLVTTGVTISSLTADAAISSVAFSDTLNLFIAVVKTVSSGNTRIRSLNGVSWTLDTTTTTTYTKIKWIPIVNKFIVLSTGVNGAVSSSDDGITWTSPVIVSGLVSGEEWLSISYSPTLNRYVLIGGQGKIRYSSDLINWSSTSIPNYLGSWVKDVQWIGDYNIFMFTCIGTNNQKLFISYDGINWFLPNFLTIQTTNSFKNFAYSPTLKSILVLNDSGTPRILSNLINNNYSIKNTSDIKDLNKVFKPLNLLQYTTDNWNNRTLVANNNWSSVCYSQELELFAAVSSSGTNNSIATSSNGWDWTQRNSPVMQTSTSSAQIPSLTKKTIAVGSQHSLALMSDGTIRAWGKNSLGQLGNGTLTDSLTPLTVSEINNAIAIVSNGGSASLALFSNGTIKSWGDNYQGQLGDGTTIRARTPVTVSGINNAIDIVNSGNSHALALLSDGTIKAWGWNTYGQLGVSTNSGNTSANPTPVTVSEINNAISIAAGESHSLALLSDGTIKAWGRNNRGQLGNTTNNGTDNPNPTPVTIPGITNAIAIAAGELHSLALLSDGTIKALGTNQYGELGNTTNSGTTNANPIPVTVSGINNAIAISSGYNHSLALLSDGTIKAWGINNKGQLGVSTNSGTNNPNPTPVTIPGINNAISIICGYENSAVLLSDGTMKIWGRNLEGQFGNNTSNSTDNYIPTTPQTSASDSSALSNIKVNTQLGTITTYSDNNWTSVCWSPQLSLFAAVANSGTNNRIMTSPNGTTWTSRNSPSTSVTTTTTLASIKSISAGTEHSVVLMSNGTIKAWGNNFNGQVGDGTIMNTKTTPVNVSGISTAIQVLALGYDFSMALLSDGTIKTWGRNTQGQLGATNSNSDTIVTVDGINNAIAISGGSGFGIALLSDGTIKGWGTNYYGQLGMETNTGTDNPNSTPVSIPGITNAIAISNVMQSGTGHVLAILSDGTIKAWGANDAGQLGVETNNGTENPNYTPVTVPNISNAISVAASAYHSLALLSDGTIKAWGSNRYGQLGDGTSNLLPNPTPVTVSGISNAIAIFAAATSSYALLSNGTIKTWGYNLFTNNENALTPITISGITNAVAMSSGNGYILILLSDGTIKAIGQNNYGQLGNNSTTNSNSFVNVHTSSEDSTTLSNIKINTQSTTTTTYYDNNWTSICWSSELNLFVAVANSGTGNRIMTSSNGTSWTIRTSPVDNNWTSVTWSPELGIFVAVANSGTGNRVMTSSNGTSWIIQSSPADNNWTSVCWHAELLRFVAVASSGSNRIMTSDDGITWTARIAPANNEWSYVTYVPQFDAVVAIAKTGSKRIMISKDSINWTLEDLTLTNSWNSICWSPDHAIFVVAGTNRIIQSFIAYATNKNTIINHPRQIRIDKSDTTVKMGINITPTYQLQLSADSAVKPSSSTWTVSSDYRLKEDIELADLNICYNNLKNLRLVKYKWKDSAFTPEQVPDRSKLGWIAQEVEVILPKAVRTISFPIKKQKIIETNIIVTEEANTEVTLEANTEVTPEVNTEVTEEANTEVTPEVNTEVTEGANTEVTEEIVMEEYKSLDSDQIIATLYGGIKKLITICEEQNILINNLDTKSKKLKEFINNLEVQVE